MKRILLVIVCLSAASCWASDYYKLEMVSRVDQNLYSASSGGTKVLIETQYCYEMAAGVNAILKYDRYGYGNKLIFDDNQSCDVVKVVAQ